MQGYSKVETGGVITSKNVNDQALKLEPNAVTMESVRSQVLADAGPWSMDRSGKTDQAYDKTLKDASGTSDKVLGLVKRQ